jgi:hypothetical protein
MIVIIQSKVVKCNTTAGTNKWYHPALQKKKKEMEMEMRKENDTIAEKQSEVIVGKIGWAFGCNVIDPRMRAESRQ